MYHSLKHAAQPRHSANTVRTPLRLYHAIASQKLSPSHPQMLNRLGSQQQQHNLCHTVSSRKRLVLCTSCGCVEGEE